MIFLSASLFFECLERHRPGEFVRNVLFFKYIFELNAFHRPHDNRSWPVIRRSLVHIGTVPVLQHGISLIVCLDQAQTSSP